MKVFLFTVESFNVGLEEGREISRNCVSNEPWKDRFVLQCYHCSCWFHGEFVNISEKDEEDIVDY